MSCLSCSHLNIYQNRIKRQSNTNMDNKAKCILTIDPPKGFHVDGFFIVVSKKVQVPFTSYYPERSQEPPGHKSVESLCLYVES